MAERELQSEIVGWLYAVGYDNTDVESQILKLGEEYGEVMVEYEGDQEHLAEELVDVAIVSIGILGLLNVNFEEAAHEKVALTRQKYNPATIQALRDQGYSLHEALRIMKTAWNENDGLVYQHPLPGI